MRTVLNILLVQLFQFSQTEISFWCWFPGIHSRKLSKHWLLYISDYFAGVGVTLGKLLAWLRRSEFDWHPQLIQFLHKTVASGSSVFPWCCHLLRVIERDRVYFLLKNLIAVPSQLHLVHCNQTNHGGWWSMIAFRLACLHIVLSLSFFFFFFFLFMDTCCKCKTVKPWRWKRDRGLEKHLLSLWNHDCTASDYF